MTSSRSFFVDALLLQGKNRHRYHQTQQHRARRNDEIMLQLPLLRQTLPSVSHSAFALYPYIAGSGSTPTAEVRRGMESGIVHPPLPCLSAAAGLPPCLCSFCLPFTGTAVGSPTRDGQQRGGVSPLADGDERALSTSPTAQRREWQPWLQTTSAAESQRPQSTSTKTELSDRLQNHPLTVTGACYIR